MSTREGDITEGEGGASEDEIEVIVVALNLKPRPGVVAGKPPAQSPCKSVSIRHLQEVPRSITPLSFVRESPATEDRVMIAKASRKHARSGDDECSEGDVQTPRRMAPRFPKPRMHSSLNSPKVRSSPAIPSMAAAMLYSFVWYVPHPRHVLCYDLLRYARAAECVASTYIFHRGGRRPARIVPANSCLR